MTTYLGHVKIPVSNGPKFAYPKGIKSKYENAVKGEVLDTLVQETVEKEFKEKNIRPALRPKVELEKFEVTEKHDTHRSTGFRAGS